jgi:hypothetical protein
LGDFFTNKSGHPGRNRHFTHRDHHRIGN